MFQNISVKLALKLVQEGKAVLYDLRDGDVYEKGHLPFAKHSTKELLEKELRSRSVTQKKNQLTIVYCDYGNQSMRVAKELSEKGYEGLASMVGGYHAYEEYIEIKKKNLHVMEWKDREEKSVDSRTMDK